MIWTIPKAAVREFSTVEWLPTATDHFDERSPRLQPSIYFPVLEHWMGAIGEEVGTRTWRWCPRPIGESLLVAHSPARRRTSVPLEAPTIVGYPTIDRPRFPQRLMRESLDRVSVSLAVPAR
jgi:hypothetical protein